MTGTVYKTTGKLSTVKLEDGSFVECTVKGKFRMKGIRTTNPVAVGDQVNIEFEKDESGVITKLHDRKNYIIRKSVNLSKEAHIIGANLDQALLIASIEQPETTTTFIDRFLVNANAYKVPVIIVFNKVDILQEAGLVKLQYLTESYMKIGYKVMHCSGEKNLGVDDIRKELEGKTSLLTGHSGVGKSTLINCIEEGLNIKTTRISESHQQGQHTTTFAEMYDLKNGGRIIDTPGIRGFGMVRMEEEEVPHYFPEFMELLPECKYHNCRHLNEPQCAVLDAVDAEIIPGFRYLSYLNILGELNGDDHFRTNPYKS